MQLKQAIESIKTKLQNTPWNKPTQQEMQALQQQASINAQARVFLALAMLLQSTCRFSKLNGTFLGYDNLQTQALQMLEQATEQGCEQAIFYLAEVFSGLFGKFPMRLDEAKALYQKYCNLTNDEQTRAHVLQNWQQFAQNRKQIFQDKVLVERTMALNLPQTGLGSHDQGYYESLSRTDKKE